MSVLKGNMMDNNKLNELLNQMTLDEKIGQLCQYNANLFIGTDAKITGPLLQNGLTPEKLKTVGSVLNFSSVEEFCKIQAEHLSKDRNKIPLCFMMDVIHGYRTIYPIPLGLGCSFDTDLVAECTKMAAREAASSGVQATFAPMVDYVRDARWGRVMETCGEDPLLNSIMGVAQVKAYRGDDLSNENSIATCVKHFAGYGGAEAGRDYNTVDVSEHTLREYYLPAYKACLDAGVDMIMPSFNVLNGMPSTANRWLMQTILKDEWKSDAIVISDYNAIGELITHGVAENKKDATRLSFENGCDIDMCSSSYMNSLKDLVLDGVVTEDSINKAVYKVLCLKNRLGLFENPYHFASPERSEKECLNNQNRLIARKAAEESAVLLKNEKILPISKNVKSIALIGPFADNHEINGPWSCKGENEDTVTIKQGISTLIPDAQLTVVKGCSNVWDDTDESGFSEAIKAASKAELVILCLGEPQNYSGEGNCRVNIELPGLQEKLTKEIVKVNKNTVAVIFTGRPLALTNISNTVPAILNMWFPGTEGGNAVARLLFGFVNPCGKLSISFPKNSGQCPIYYNRLNTGRPKAKESEDIYLPYTSNYIDCGNLPLYPFGYGLSYSNFMYKSLDISKSEMSADEKVTVKIKIENNSEYSGKETVLLFMRDVVSSRARPIQQLIAFKKVDFNAGEEKTVEFKIDESMLRFWNNENKYVSEKGLFEISTGYADNLILTKKLILL